MSLKKSKGHKPSKRAKPSPMPKKKAPSVASSKSAAKSSSKSTSDDRKMTKDQLVKELAKLRRRITILEKAKTESKRVEDELHASTALLKLEKDKREIEHSLGERVKELNCLYSLSELIDKHGGNVEKILQGITNFFPISWQYPDITCARILFEENEFVSSNFRTSKWKQSSDIYLLGDKVGAVEVYYVKKMPDIYEGPFLKEERLLIDAVAERIGLAIVRIRAEKSLRESEARWRAFLTNAPDIIFVTDRDGMIQYINYAPEGLTTEEAIGTNVYGYVPKDHHETLRQALKNVFKTGEPDSFEILARGPMDEPAWYTTRISAIKRNGRVMSAMMITHDITERKQAEDDLKKAHGELESKVEERTVELVATVKQLNDEITERKSVEHELRQSREFIENLVNTANVMLIALDSNGHIALFNEMAESVTGYSKEELAGKDWFQVLVPKDKYPEVWEVFESAASKKEYPRQFTNPIITKSGEERIISWQNSTLWEGDRFISTVSFGMDVTEQMKAEEELRIDAAMFENLAEGIYLIGLDDLIIKWANPIFEEMFGYEPGEMVGKQVDIVNAPTDITPTETRDSIVDILKESGEWHGEVENMKKDGTHFWCYANVSLFDHPEFGKVMVSVHRDITRRKKLEAELLQREELYKKLYEHSGTNISIMNKEGIFLLVNDEAAIMLGGKPDDYIGKSLFDVFPEEEAKKYIESNRKTIETGIAKKYEQTVMLSGSKRTLLVFEQCIMDSSGKGYAVQFSSIDITDRKRAEEKLKESEKRLRHAQRVAKLGHWDLNVVTGDLYWSDESYRILGFKPQEFVPSYDKFRSIVHPDDMDFVQMHVDKALKEDVKYNIDFRIVLPSGKIRYINVQGDVTRDEDDNAIRFFGTQIDITDRKHDEEEIRFLRDFYGNILNSIINGVWVSDKDDVVYFANRGLGVIMEVEPRKIEGTHALEDDPENILRHFRQHYLEAKKTLASLFYDSINITAPSGRQGYYSGWLIPRLKDGKYDGMICTVQDFTDRKLALEALKAHEEKLAAMAMELSMTEERERQNIAGDLHDNIAQSLAMTRVELGKISEQASGDVGAKLDSVKTQVDQIINDTRSLIFDISPPVLYELGFKEAVEWVAERIQEQHGIRIMVIAGKQHSTIDQEVSVILFKAVRELLMNVVKHAKATTVEVTLKDVEDSIHVLVKDDGIGFDVAKIRDDLKSTSFGIFSLRERVKYIGGTIEFSSGPGQGTTVEIIVSLTSA